jgi:hypothetical protein
MNSAGLLFIFSIIGVVGFGALLVVGLIMLRQEQAAKRAKLEGAPDGAAEAKAQENRVLEAGRSLFKTRSKAADALDAHEVLRVLRDRLTGRLIVEIAGRRYTQVGDIQDPNIQRGFLTTLQDLGSFAATAPAPAAPVAPPDAPAHSTPLASTHPGAAEGQPQSASPAPAATPATEPAPRPRPPTPQPISNAPISNAPQPRADAPLQLPSMNVFKQMQVLRERAKQPPPPPPKSITEQIDEILQEKIAGTPHRTRGLHVGAGPQGHAVFELDGKNYEAVDDLPDAEARLIVRAAIAEWEKRQ